MVVRVVLEVGAGAKEEFPPKAAKLLERLCITVAGLRLSF